MTRDYARRVACAGAVGALLVIAGCGASGSTQPRDTLLGLRVPDQVTLEARHVAGFGDVLVDGQGHSLYMFPPDAGSQVRCTGGCAGTWPPLVIANGHNATASKGVDANAIGSVPDPNSGQRVVTYNGYPLYAYAGDLAAGTANGQALFLDGGPWYLLDPHGEPITASGGPST